MAETPKEVLQPSLSLLDLPIELICLIIRHSYEAWTLKIWNILGTSARSSKLAIGGYPGSSLLTTCRTLSAVAKEAEVKSFTGILRVDETMPEMSYLCFALMDRLLSTKSSKHRYKWLTTYVHTISYASSVYSPTVWKFRDFDHRCFSNLRRIELDCRFPSLFAIHNVPDVADFLSGNDGRLRRHMDYLQAYFLSCEKFLLECVRHGVAVTVVRDMGVRELNERCLGVVVAINYVNNGYGNVMLDMESLRHRSATIFGWPYNIRPTLAELQL